VLSFASVLDSAPFSKLKDELLDVCAADLKDESKHASLIAIDAGVRHASEFAMLPPSVDFDSIVSADKSEFSDVFSFAPEQNLPPPKRIRSMPEPNPLDMVDFFGQSVQDTKSLLLDLQLLSENSSNSSGACASLTPGDAARAELAKPDIVSTC